MGVTVSSLDVEAIMATVTVKLTEGGRDKSMAILHGQNERKHVMSTNVNKYLLLVSFQLCIILYPVSM